MKRYNFGIMCKNVHDFIFGSAEVKKERELREQAYNDVQVKEFNGFLWLCHRGIPLVRQDWAKIDLADLAQNARENWITYQKRRELIINKQISK